MSGGLAQQEALFSAPGEHDLIQTSEHAFNDPILQVTKWRQRGRNDSSKVTQPHRTKLSSFHSLILFLMTASPSWKPQIRERFGSPKPQWFSENPTSTSGTLAKSHSGNPCISVIETDQYVLLWRSVWERSLVFKCYICIKNINNLL